MNTFNLEEEMMNKYDDDESFKKDAIPFGAFIESIKDDAELMASLDYVVLVPVTLEEPVIRDGNTYRHRIKSRVQGDVDMVAASVFEISDGLPSIVQTKLGISLVKRAGPLSMLQAVREANSQESEESSEEEKDPNKEIREQIENEISAEEGGERG